MKYYLIKGEFNWADEADFESLRLFTETELNEAREYCKKKIENDETEEREIYVGSNEEIEVDVNDVYEYLEAAVEIPEEIYNFLTEKECGNIGMNLYDLFRDMDWKYEDSDEDDE